VASTLKDDQKAEERALAWPKEKNPKELRYEGCNVSRSFADFSYSCTVDNNSYKVLSCKPKLTINKLQKGDILLIGSDGFWDFLEPKKIAKELPLAADGKQSLAQNLCELAMKQDAYDNIYLHAVIVD
jgi:serine/threonine protein phosphatase PrpC